MIRKILPLLGLTIILSACPKPQKYVRPTMPAPEDWTRSASGPAPASTAPLGPDVGWRQYFPDPKLQSMIELALANNRDLRLAALNIEKVQALYRIQDAAQYPVVSADAGAEFYRTPKKMSATGQAETVQQYRINLGVAAWEPDFFGRVRSLKSQALEQYLATEQARAATQISLVAAVAQSYLALAADRENLGLARATLDAHQASVDLIRQSRDLGISSDLDVREAQAQVDADRVDIAHFEGQVALDRNALDLLAGTPVDTEKTPGDLGSVQTLPEIAAGLPSAVLLRRPDILMMEHRLKAAYANIGAARAAFFPRIALTAGAGLVSGDLADLFRIGSATWSFVPQVTMPLFDHGSRKANYQVAEADRDLAVAEYERAVQVAFREVCDALSQRTHLASQQEAQQSLVKTLEATCRLAEARYKAGIDGYLNVLVVQRSLYAAQRSLVVLRLARLNNLVTLYKVLGGGADAGPAGVLPGGGIPPVK